MRYVVASVMCGSELVVIVVLRICIRICSTAIIAAGFCVILHFLHLALVIKLLQRHAAVFQRLSVRITGILKVICHRELEDCGIAVIDILGNFYGILVFVQHFHIKAQRLQFLQKDLEGFRDTAFRDVFTFNDRLIRLDTANHIIL